jgi:hypothetical protein
MFHIQAVAAANKKNMTLSPYNFRLKNSVRKGFLALGPNDEAILGPGEEDLSNCFEYSPSWEADIRSQLFIKLSSSLLCSHTLPCLYPESEESSPHLLSL